jgi:hypothetical protein
VRVGIGRPPGRMDAAEFVLRDFGTSERKELPFLVGDAADAAEMVVTEGLVAAQQRFHSPACGPAPRPERRRSTPPCAPAGPPRALSPASRKLPSTTLATALGTNRAHLASNHTTLSTKRWRGVRHTP